MGEPLTARLLVAPLDDVRRFIADRLLAGRPIATPAVGDIALWPHQRDAVARIRAAIGEFGGALLADDVGMGKTFVALAVAAPYASPLVVAPAALRGTWRTAALHASRIVQFASFESLSRRRRPDATPDFVIVDEAHHARNPLTHRYGELSAIVADTPLLLLTATPIHNRRDDLVALLALFLGRSAATLSRAALSRCVIRRARDVLAEATTLPDVRGPFTIPSDHRDDATPDAILSLPPPLPPADGGTAGALLAVTLLRQWASSQGALLAGIRRRLAVAHALSATLEDGRYPTRAEIAAWTLGDDAQQLALGAIVSPGHTGSVPADLRDAVAAHAAGLRMLRRIVAADPERDLKRARRLRDLLDTHPGARLIAFSQFAETIDAYWRALRHLPGICAVTAAGARIASGAIPRAEALGSLAPGHSSRAGPARRITLLLTTDLASEGLDLQDASVLVHLDLPWTPARLEQRLGRIVRPGSPHRSVHVYSMEPPAPAATLLGIKRRLAEKLTAARATLGAVMPDIGILLPDSPAPAHHAPASSTAAAVPALEHAAAPTASAEQLESIFEAWRRLPRVAALITPAGSRVIVASLVAPTCGWLALVGDGERARLIARAGDRTGDDPALVVHLCRLIDLAAAPNGSRRATAKNAAFVADSIEQLGSWLETQRAAALAGVADIPLVHGRRRALAAIARLADAPASTRDALAAPAAQALGVASGRLAAGRERSLRQFTTARGNSPREWLDALGALGTTRTRRASPQFAAASVLAFIALGPPP